MKKSINKESYYNKLKNLSGIKPINENIGESTNKLNASTLICTKKAADGTTYGVVKENHNYYIKKGLVNEPKGVEDFMYINGIQNKTDYQYPKSIKAEKNMDMLINSINESYNKINFKKKTTSSNKEIIKEEKTLKQDVKEEVATEKETIQIMASFNDEPPFKVDTTNSMEDAEKLKKEYENSFPKDFNIFIKGISENIEDELDQADSMVDNAIEAEKEDKTNTDDGSDEEIDIDSIDVSDKETELDDESEEKNDGENDGDEISKSLGKLTTKIRNLDDISDSKVKYYVNTFLSAFKKEFKNIDIEDRKEMADRILKVVEDSDEDVNEGSKGCNECGFTKFVSEMGYNSESIMECDVNEMANLMSSYITEKDDLLNLDKSDLEDMSVFSSPEIEECLKNEYGYSEISEMFKPYTEKLNEIDGNGKKEKIKTMFWWEAKPSKLTVSENYDEEQGDVPGEQDTGPDEYSDEIVNNEMDFRSYANTVLKNAHGEEFDEEKAEYFIDSLVKMVNNKKDKNWGAAVGILQQSLDENMDPASVETQPNVTDENEPNFTPGFDNLGVSTPTKSPEAVVTVKTSTGDNVDVNLNEETKKKLVKYIRNRVDEKLGKRKSVVNESKKSVKAKLLDRIIDEQFEQYKENLDESEFIKKVSRGMEKASQWLEGGLKKQKMLKNELPKINTQDSKEINKLFFDVFGNKMSGAVSKYSQKASPELKLDIMKKAISDPDGLGTITIQGQNIGYKPVKDIKIKSQFADPSNRSRVGQ